MGLLKHLLFWPVTGPAFLTRFSLEKVDDTVRAELTDDHAVKEALLELQLRLELGEIDDDQYVEQEAVLMQRLRDVRRWREEFGMGSSGGPVRIAGSGESEEAERSSRSAEDVDDVTEESESGGIASPEGARVELDLDWD